MQRCSGAILTGMACLAILGIVPGAGAQGQSSKASSADKAFVTQAAEGGMAEVQLGKIAAEKANNPDVKRFGQKMVDDHTDLNKQMKPVASAIGITPPAQLSPKDQALKKKLETLSGPAFDKAYMKAIVKDHTKDLAEFQKEASRGQSSAVKADAQQGGLVIKQHLQLAKKIAGEVGAIPGGKESNVSTEIK